MKSEKKSQKILTKYKESHSPRWDYINSHDIELIVQASGFVLWTLRAYYLVKKSVLKSSVTYILPDREVEDVILALWAYAYIVSIVHITSCYGLW